MEKKLQETSLRMQRRKTALREEFSHREEEKRIYDEDC